MSIFLLLGTTSKRQIYFYKETFEKLNFVEHRFCIISGETGVAPVSYIKVEDANVISLALPPPIRHRSNNIFTTAQQKIKDNSNFVPDRESLHDEAPMSGSNDQMVPKRVPNVAQMSKSYLPLTGP